jgi:hypothetical protein
MKWRRRRESDQRLKKVVLGRPERDGHFYENGMAPECGYESGRKGKASPDAASVLRGPARRSSERLSRRSLKSSAN